MYLSRIKLNSSRTQTMRALVAPNVFHGAIEICDENRRRKLWRVDTLGGEQYLLVLSEEQFDLTKAAEQFGYDSCYDSKPYEVLLERIVKGSRWQFRLIANPTVQIFDEKKGRGKVIAHISTKFQGEWLKKQAEKHGFSLNDEEWLITGSKWYTFRKNRSSKNTVKMLAVTYEGVLTVTNAESFRKALCCGIGREKAYGMGMLTVMRPK